MNEYDSDYFLKHWKEQLKEYCQPWPEWKELENLIHTLSFELIYEEYMNANYLVSWMKKKNEQGGALGPFPNPWESIPEDQKLFLLQTTISGTDFFCSSKQIIYVIDSDNKKYLPIGKLDDFIRWCIRINLELKNWHNAFFKKIYFNEYNLKYQDTWMD